MQARTALGSLVLSAALATGGLAVPASAAPANHGEWSTPNGRLVADVTDHDVTVAYLRTGFPTDVAVGYIDNTGDHRSSWERLSPGQQLNAAWGRGWDARGCVTVYAQFRNDREEHQLCP